MRSREILKPSVFKGMPLIKVQASVDAPEKEKVDQLLKSLSGKLAQHLSKSESYVMTAFEPGVAMREIATIGQAIAWV